jgi:hypothetical protein
MKQKAHLFNFILILAVVSFRILPAQAVIEDKKELELVYPIVPVEEVVEEKVVNDDIGFRCPNSPSGFLLIDSLGKLFEPVHKAISAPNSPSGFLLVDALKKNTDKIFSSVQIEKESFKEILKTHKITRVSLVTELKKGLPIGGIAKATIRYGMNTDSKKFDAAPKISGLVASHGLMGIVNKTQDNNLQFSTSACTPGPAGVITGYKSSIDLANKEGKAPELNSLGVSASCAGFYYLEMQGKNSHLKWYDTPVGRYDSVVIKSTNQLLAEVVGYIPGGLVNLGLGVRITFSPKDASDSDITDNNDNDFDDDNDALDHMIQNI